MPEPEWLLEEYKDIGENARRDDIIAWTIGSIFITAAFGAILIWAAYRDAAPILGAGSVAMIWFWFLLTQRFAWYTQIRYARAQEIESLLGLNQHRLIHNPERGFRIGINAVGFIITAGMLRLALAVSITGLWLLITENWKAVEIWAGVWAAGYVLWLIWHALHSRRSIRQE